MTRMKTLFIAITSAMVLMTATVYAAEERSSRPAVTDSAVIEQTAPVAATENVDPAAAAVAEKAEATTAQWITDFGNAIGVGIASIAKELGLAANEIATSPLGILAIVLIVFHMFGATIFKVLFGTIFLIVFIRMWNKYFRLLCLVKEIKEVDGKETVTYYTAEEAKSVNGLRFMMSLILLVGIAVSLSIIF